MICPIAQGDMQKTEYFFPWQNMCIDVPNCLAFLFYVLLSFRKQKVPSFTSLHDKDLYPLWKIRPAIYPQFFSKSPLFICDQHCPG